MGKSSQTVSIQHFSHPDHPLELTAFDHSTAPPPVCAACAARISAAETAYSCKLCRFILHVDCSKLPQLILHPAHRDHSLTLLPVPAYPGGLFNCDACGRDGTGFSYHCAACSLDVHTSCASKPLSVIHREHSHPLFLAFCPPYENKSFSCDICRGTGANHWFYRCATCEFDAHIGCATAIPAAPPLQPQPQQQHWNQTVSPYAMSAYPNGKWHSRSWHCYGGPVGAPVPEIHRAASTGNSHLFGIGPAMGMPGFPQRLPNASGGSGTGYNGNAHVNDFVSSMVQQAGQDVLQTIIGGGGSGSGSGGDGESILDSIMSKMNAVGGSFDLGN